MLNESDDEARVVEAVRWLNDAYASSRLELAIRIGHFLREEVFGGVDDPSRNHPSFRAIAEHPELRLSHSYLWYALRIATQVEELPEAIAYSLSVSQHRRLTAVRDPAHKRVLAERALAEQWTVKELDAEIARTVERSSGGRPPKPPLARLAAEVAKAVDKAEAAEEPIATLTHYERAQLGREIDGYLERLRRLRRLLG